MISFCNKASFNAANLNKAMNSKPITFVKNIELEKCPSGFQNLQTKRTREVGLEGGLMLAGQPAPLVLKIGLPQSQVLIIPFIDMTVKGAGILRIYKIFLMFMFTSTTH